MVRAPEGAMRWAKPRLVEDLRGLWFIVLPEGAGADTIGSPWVVLEVGGERKLFYSLRRGRRVAELVPISPASGAWWDRARRAEVRASWPARLDAGLRLSDPVAVVGESGGARVEGLVWLGEAPRGAWTGVVVSERWGEDGGAGDNPMASVSGEVEGEGRALRSVTPRGLSGLVLAEPARGEGATVRVALFTKRADDAALRKELGEVEGVEVTVHPARELPAWRAQVLRPWALEVGADVVALAAIRSWGGALVLGVMPAEGPAALTYAAPALGRTMLRAATLHQMAQAARGLGSLRQGQPLVAAYRLGRVELTGGGEASLRWRAAELVGSAGRAQWLAYEVARRRPFPDAPELVTLARASLLEGSPRQAARLAREAEAAFATWRHEAARLGQGRAALTLAQALAADDDPAALPEAIEAAERADVHLKAARDELRRARVALVRATLHARREDRDRALLDARLARSRAFHGGDPLLCAQAELLLARLLALEPTARQEAVEMARNAERRLATAQWAAGVTLAQITRLAVSPTDHPDPERRPDPSTLRATLDARRLQAERLGARDVAAAASAAWVLADRQEPPEAIAAHGATMVRGWSASSGAAHAPQLTRALTLLCPQGLASSTPRAAEVCAVATQRAPRDADMLGALLDRGHRLLDAHPLTVQCSQDERCSHAHRHAVALAATARAIASAANAHNGLKNNKVWQGEAALLTTRARLTADPDGPEALKAGDLWLATVNPAAPPTAELTRAELATRRGRPRLAAHLIRGALTRHATHQPDALVSRRELSWALLDHLITHRAPAATIQAALTTARPLMRPAPASTEPPVDDLLWHLYDATLRAGADDADTYKALTTRAAALPDLYQLAFWVRAASLQAAIARAHHLTDLTRRDHALVARLRTTTDTIERLITGLSPRAYELPAHRLTLHRALWWRAFALITDGKRALATPLLKELITRTTDHPPSALIRARAQALQ